MARRVPRNPARGGGVPATSRGGRPSKLTERTEDAIIHAVMEGNHLTTAAAAAGVSQSTLYRWIEAANDVEEAIDAGKPYDVHALRYLQFRDRLADARAQAEMRAVQVVNRQMVGGYLIHEKPLQNVNGDPIYGPDGELLVERTYAQPDGRLALAYLNRSRPGSWGQSATNRVELTGSGGGPVQVEHAEKDHIESLAARLAAVAEQIRSEDGDGDGDDVEVVDAEIVDEREDRRGA